MHHNRKLLGINVPFKKKLYFINIGKSIHIWKKNTIHMCLSVTGPDWGKRNATALLNYFGGNFRTSGSRDQSKDFTYLLPCPLQKQVPPTCPLDLSHSLACVWHLLPPKHPEPRTDVVMGGVWKPCPMLQPSHHQQDQEALSKRSKYPHPFHCFTQPTATNQSSVLTWVNEAGVSPYSFVKIEKANNHNI